MKSGNIRAAEQGGSTRHTKVIKENDRTAEEMLEWQTLTGLASITTICSIIPRAVTGI